MSASILRDVTSTLLRHQESRGHLDRFHRIGEGKNRDGTGILKGMTRINRTWEKGKAKENKVLALLASDVCGHAQVNDVGKKTGGIYVPDLLQVIVTWHFGGPASCSKVRAVVVAAIKAAPNQLGNPLADSLGAGDVAW